MKKLIITALSIFLIACGAPAKRTEMGIANNTQIIVVADKLVGARLEVGTNLNVTIEKTMLDKYTKGVLGAADRPEEGMQSVTVKVDPGSHSIRLINNGQVLINKTVYVSEGQTTKVGK